jgi:hypothetical protein
VYVVMRRLSSRLAATCCLLACAMPFSWMLHVGGALASGLALMEMMWLLVALNEGRPLAIALLLALVFYTHLGLAWIALAMIALAWMLGGLSQPRAAATGTAIGLALASPWLWHLCNHVQLMSVAPRMENQYIDLLPAVVLLAAWGAVRAWRQQGGIRCLLALWLAFGLMAVSFRFRWLSGEGVVPVALLAGYGLAGILEALGKRQGQPYVAGPLFAIAGLILAISPTLVIEKSRLRWQWLDTAPFHLVSVPGLPPKPMDLSLYDPHMERLVKKITAISGPGEILWSNAPYAGGLVAALAHRAVSSAMFFEVPTRSGYDPLAAAHLLIWFKMAPGAEVGALQPLIERYRFRLVENDELAWIFRRDGEAGLARAPRSVVPLWLAFVLLCGAFGLAAWRLWPSSNAKGQWEN